MYVWKKNRATNGSVERKGKFEIIFNQSVITTADNVIKASLKSTPVCCRLV